MSKKLEFGTKMKLWLIIPMVLGALAMGYTFFWNEGFNQNARFWSNLLLNTYYFAGIAITGIFFITAHHLGYGGWQTVFKRVPMAMAQFLYVAFVLMLIITAGLYFDWHNLYGHWSSAHGLADKIVQGKLPFLTKGFYAVVVLGFFLSWALFARLMYTKFMSIKNIKEYENTKALSAIFLLVFGVSSSVLSWLVVMSMDPHWYSTLFGWYNMASYFAAGMSLMALILIYLKGKGLLPHLNEDHIHDVAKFMFGFSIFWTYLWFSQFMLIWYANIPEATVYFNKRFDVPLFKFILLFNLVINFLAPLLIILRRKDKRNFKLVSFIAVLIIFGHYLDFYGMIMLEPMAVVEHHGDGHHGDEHHSNAANALYAEHHTEEAHHNDAHSDVEEAHHADAHGAVAHDAHANDHYGDKHKAKNLAILGLPEILIFFGFLALFLYIVFNTLKDKEIEITEDPFLKESLHHHFDY